MAGVLEYRFAVTPDIPKCSQRDIYSQDLIFRCAEKHIDVLPPGGEHTLTEAEIEGRVCAFLLALEKRVQRRFEYRKGLSAKRNEAIGGRIISLTATITGKSTVQGRLTGYNLGTGEVCDPQKEEDRVLDRETQLMIFDHAYERMLKHLADYHADANKSLVYLYNVMEQLKEIYGDEDKARQALSLSANQWKAVRRIIHNPQIRTSRHPGKSLGPHRDIKPDEQRKCENFIRLALDRYRDAKIGTP